MALGESSGHPMPNTPSQTVRQTHSGGSNAVDDPHARSNHTVPPQRTLALWTEVAHGIDKNQTGENLIRDGFHSTQGSLPYVGTYRGYQCFIRSIYFSYLLCTLWILALATPRRKETSLINYTIV